MGISESCTDDWIKKMWYIYTMECYSAIRKHEILTLSTAWMNFENIMPSEINQRKMLKII